MHIVQSSLVLCQLDSLISGVKHPVCYVLQVRTIYQVRICLSKVKNLKTRRGRSSHATVLITTRVKGLICTKTILSCTNAPHDTIFTSTSEGGVALDKMWETKLHRLGKHLILLNSRISLNTLSVQTAYPFCRLILTLE